MVAFPQVPVERELYMKIPKGVRLDGKDLHNYIPKLHKNTYGQKIPAEYGTNTWLRNLIILALNNQVMMNVYFTSHICTLHR